MVIHKKIEFYFFICLLIVVASEGSCFSEPINNLQVSRYGTIAVVPSDAQINPLQAIVQIHFPPETKTIRQAIEFLLNNTGFNLASQAQLSPEVISTLSKLLPIVDRNLGPITINQALTVLMGGNVFNLKVDELNREVNFNLQPQYISRSNKNNPSISNRKKNSGV